MEENEGGIANNVKCGRGAKLECILIKKKIVWNNWNKCKNMVKRLGNFKGGGKDKIILLRRQK